MSVLADLLFPPICPGCGTLSVEKGESICAACRVQIAAACYMPCSRCGRPHISCNCRLTLPSGTEIPYLPMCGIRQVHLAVYRTSVFGVTERMLLRAKNKRLVSTADFFARRLAKRLQSECEGALITYVPRQPRKVRMTGTDQARMLAASLSRCLGIPCRRLLKRVGGGGDQKKKDSAERFFSSIGRYRLTRSAAETVRGRRVYLCDDVITTGASMLICAALMLRAGASEVIAVSAARTDRQRPCRR